MSARASAENSAALAEADSAGESAAWMRRRGVPAWLLSLLLHLTVFTVLGLTFQVRPRGGNDGDELPRGGEIVLAQATGTKTSYFAEGDAAAAGGSAGDSTAASEETIQPLPDEDQRPGGGPQLPQSSGISGALPHGFGPGDDPLGTGLATGGGGSSGKGLGKGTQTQVFGVRGQGSRFIYVFDRSSSMAGFEGRPLAGAKRELIASLAHLEKLNQFQIIFYNQEPRLMRLPDGSSGMVFANEEGKRLAGDYIEQVTANGATRHLEALTAALYLRPDVIFFLTDADEPRLSAGELAKIRRLNQGASINAIEFGAGAPPGGTNFLKQLAQQNGGNYGYVDVTRLPK